MPTPDRDASGGPIDWAVLYRDVYTALVQYLYRKVWDAARAEELAQEVFVRALGARPDNPRAWLFTVAGNLATDEARVVIRRKKHLALLKRDVAADPPRVDPVLTMEREARAQAVRRALETLTERDREVLLLRDAGFSYPEIAERTGLSVGAIGTTLSRARKRLVEAHASLLDGEERRQVGPPERADEPALASRVAERRDNPGNRVETHAARR